MFNRIECMIYNRIEYMINISRVTRNQSESNEMHEPLYNCAIQQAAD